MPQSANVINGTEYTQLATKYGQLVTVLKASSVYMYDALTIIANMDEVAPTRDLIVAFDSVYQQNAGQLGSEGKFLEVVRALNGHVLSRARNTAGTTYSDINDWFAAQESEGFDISFPRAWADMCALTGSTVDNTFVTV